MHSLARLCVRVRVCVCVYVFVCARERGRACVSEWVVQWLSVWTMGVFALPSSVILGSFTSLIHSSASRSWRLSRKYRPLLTSQSLDSLDHCGLPSYRLLVAACRPACSAVSETGSQAGVFAASVTSGVRPLNQLWVNDPILLLNTIIHTQKKQRISLSMANVTLALAYLAAFVQRTDRGLKVPSESVWRDQAVHLQNTFWIFRFIWLKKTHTKKPVPK